MGTLQYYLYIVGAVMLSAFTFIDWLSFKFYPVEAGVFIDVAGRRREDFERFKQIKNYVAVTETKQTIYSILNQRMHRRITFTEVLLYKEI